MLTQVIQKTKDLETRVSGALSVQPELSSDDLLKLLECMVQQQQVLENIKYKVKYVKKQLRDDGQRVDVIERDSITRQKKQLRNLNDRLVKLCVQVRDLKKYKVLIEPLIPTTQRSKLQKIVKVKVLQILALNKLKSIKKYGDVSSSQDLDRYLVQKKDTLEESYQKIREGQQELASIADDQPRELSPLLRFKVAELAQSQIYLLNKIKQKSQEVEKEMLIKDNQKSPDVSLLYQNIEDLLMLQMSQNTKLFTDSRYIQEPQYSGLLESVERDLDVRTRNYFKMHMVMNFGPESQTKKRFIFEVCIHLYLFETNSKRTTTTWK